MFRLSRNVEKSHVSKTHDVNDTLLIESNHWKLLRENHLCRVIP